MLDSRELIDFIDDLINVVDDINKRHESDSEYARFIISRLRHNMADVRARILFGDIQ